MFTDSPVPPPPVIVKHHILEGLERLSRDWETACAFREHLEARPSSEELIEFLHRQAVLDTALALAVRRKWGPGTGWLGDIHDHGREKLLEAFQFVRRGGPYLSAWLLIGFPSFRILVSHTPSTILFLAMTPRLPSRLLAARSDPDPTFASHLRGARDSIQAMLEEIS